MLGNVPVCLIFGCENLKSKSGAIRNYIESLCELGITRYLPINLGTKHCVVGIRLKS